MRQGMRASIGGLWALMFVVAAGLASAQEARPPERLLVVPFENAGRDGRLFWVSEGAATLLTGTLEAMGVGAVSRDERLKAFERLQLPPAASLSEATIIRTAQIIGATDVVMGSVSVLDGQITVTARALRLDTGRMRPALVETGLLADFFGVFDRLARQLAPSAASPPAATVSERGSLTVFENYIKGLVAETTDAQIRFLETALKLAPGFAPGRIALWQVYTALGDHAKAATAALAVPSASREYRRARFLVALSRIHLRQYDEAFALLKSLSDASPSPTVLNNLGVIQARRGATPQTGRAAYYFTKAAEADPGEPDYAFNVGYAYWLDRDPQAAIYWLTEAVRRSPADGDAHFVLGAALLATGSRVEGEREKELARQLSSTYLEWEQRPGAAAEPVPRGLERLRDDLAPTHPAPVDTGRAPADPKDRGDLAAFHADRGRRMFEQQQDEEAIPELKRSLYLLPYQPDVHLLLGRLYLRSGRVADAIDALKISLWGRDSSEAHAVLGQAYLAGKDEAAARAELKKAEQIDPTGADAKHLAAKLDGKRN
jgi:tetratricopeptide (TPR) repeat protein